jgi:hypothetical protein
METKFLSPRFWTFSVNFGPSFKFWPTFHHGLCNIELHSQLEESLSIQIPCQKMEGNKRASMDCLSTWMNACFFSSCDYAPSMETTSETKLLGPWQNAIHPFLVLFWLFLQSFFSNTFPILSIPSPIENTWLQPN